MFGRLVEQENCRCWYLSISLVHWGLCTDRGIIPRTVVKKISRCRCCKSGNATRHQRKWGLFSLDRNIKTSSRKRTYTGVKTNPEPWTSTEHEHMGIFKWAVNWSMVHQCGINSPETNFSYFEFRFLPSPT